MISSHRWSWALAAWTLFVWGQRVVNIAGDDELDTGQMVSGLVVAALFVVLGVSVAICLKRGGGRCRPLVDVLVIAGVLRWTLRTPIVLASAEWSAGFKVVHTVLWIVTVGLGVMAWREVRRPHPNASTLPAAG